MKKISVISLLTAIVFPAFAEDTVTSKNTFPKGLQFGFGVSGTTGINTFLGYNNKNFNSFWWKRFGLRFDVASFSPAKQDMNRSINNSIGDDGIKIHDKLKIDNIDMNAYHVGALVDFYPFGNTWFLGGLRISGGYMFGNLELKADIHGKKQIGSIEFDLGGRKYAYNGNEMQGKATTNWKYSGPYLGTGFDLGLIWGFKIYMDAGVVFTGNHATIDLNVPINDDLKDITSGVPQAITGAIETQYNIAKQKAVSDAQAELDKVDFYPIVKLGLMYRF